MARKPIREVNRMKLTTRAVEALAPGDREAFIWDTALPNFGLRVYSTGRKTYLIQYRNTGGRTRRPRIGDHGVLTADQARQEARRRLGAVACGEDPSEERTTRRRAISVRDLGERFLTDHVAIRCKSSTERNYRQQVRNHVIPRLGAHKVTEVTRADIAALHHAMRETPHQGNRVLAVMSKMFSLAELWGLRQDGSNPCRLIPKYREERKERFLDAEELARLSEVLNTVEANGSESPFVTAAFRLLILTGCRHGEIQKLRWDEVRGGYLHLRDTKTGARRIPLSNEALRILSTLPRTNGNPYVIEGRFPESHITDLQRPWRRIRGIADLSDVRIHDLRHTFASIAVQNGIDLLTVGKLLGHSSYQTTERYAHLADEPIRRAGQQVSGVLGDMMQTADPAPEPGRPALRLVR